MNGTVGILNVGAGDTKLSFDPGNPAERIRAARIVKDMIRRGYALLIAVGKHPSGEPVYQRAEDFDENSCEYIIADFDPLVAAEADAREEQDEPQPPAAPSDGAGAAEAPEGRRRGRPQGRRRGRPRLKRVDAGETRAVAVSRSAGG